MSNIQPTSGPGGDNIWSRFIEAGRTPGAQRRNEDPLEALLGSPHDFSDVRFDPATSLSQRLQSLNPAELQRLREAVEGETAALEGAIARGPLDPPAAAHRALQRAHIAQLQVLDQWIGVTIESKLSGWMGQQFLDMRSCERAWDFHTVQADLAQALHDYFEAGEQGAGSAAALGLDAAVQRAEMTVLTRMCHTFEYRFITAWIGTGPGRPEDPHHMASLLHDSIMLLDGILLIRDAANCYPPLAAGASCRLPAGATGSRDAQAERLPRDLDATTGLARMREQVFARHPALVAFSRTVTEVQQRFGTGELHSSSASEAAVAEARRLFQALKPPYELYADAIRTVVANDPTESAIVADYSRRDPTSEFAGLIAVPPETVAARLDGALALLKQADARLAGARAEASEALVRLETASQAYRANVKALGPPVASDRAKEVIAVGALNTVSNEAARLLDGLAFTPRPVETPAVHAAVLPTAAVALLLQSFSVARPEESADERRVRAAQNFLDMRNEAVPDAAGPGLLDRFHVTRGPCGMTLPDSV